MDTNQSSDSTASATSNTDESWAYSIRESLKTDNLRLVKD